MSVRRPIAERKRPDIPGVPHFISKSEMALCLRVTLATIDRWMAVGHFPPPWFRPGPGRKCSVWRLDHFQSFTDLEQWPQESFR